MADNMNVTVRDPLAPRRQMPPIVIGRAGEYGATTVTFDLRGLIDRYGAGVPTLLHKRPPDDEAYIVPLSAADTETHDRTEMPDPETLVWHVGQVATSYVGNGKIELQWHPDGAAKKSAQFDVVVLGTIGNPVSEIPDAQQIYLDVMQGIAEAAVSHYPRIINGVWFVWDAETGKFVSTGISAQGEDGVSPTVTVTEIEGGHRVTIADADGAHTFDVMDGEGGGSGAVQSVNGKTGAVTLTASDVNALPDSTVIPTVPAMATDPDMTDWDTGKIVDAAVLKSGFTLVGGVLSRKANVSDIPTAVSELTNDSGYQTAADVATVIAAIPAVRYDVAQSLTPAQQEHARGNIGVTETREIHGKNRMNPAELEEGVFITASGARSTNGSYAATGYIPVAPGEVIRGCYINTSGGGAQGNLGMRWIAAYDANKDVLKTLGTDTQCSTFTVPEGVSFLRISYHAATYGTTVMIEANPDGWSAYEPYGPVSHEYLEHTIRVAASQVDTENPEKEAATGIRYTFDLDANGFDGEESIEDLADYAITFRAPLPASFDGVTVARGYQIYQGGYVTVTDTTVGVYVGENSTEKLSVAHGLTLKDYISIKVEVGHDFKAKVTVGTNGGVFERSGIGWPVRVGTLSALPVGSTEIDGCELSYYCSAWNADTQLYGDSYFSVDSTERWTSYLYADGYKNVLLNAFSGRHAAQGLAAAKIVLAHSFPKRIVWCLGMNNGDNGKVNAGWKSATEELMELCEARGIELILATIPNIPTMDNTYKNAYVKASGLRYIDFAAAVGAENDTTWYDGMLSSDGVHPAAPGALALYRQAIADVPELIQKSDVPTKLSQLANDSGFQTAAQVQTVVDATAATKANSATGSNGAADMAVSIPFGKVDSTSTATAFTATVPGITELRDGVCMWLQNGKVTSASGFTLNINGLGAKPCYSSLAAESRSTTIFNVNYTLLFVYNEDRVEGGCWDIVYGVDTNTTYTLPKLGFGYAVCTTAAATAAKTASISSYALTTGGIVSIKFDHDVPAGATLNITSKGAKAIYHRGAAITAGVIKAGDTATFVYSTYYHLISIDRDETADLTNYQTKAITDAGGYYTTDTVDGALQEIGAELSGINTLIGSGVIS